MSTPSRKHHRIFVPCEQAARLLSDASERALSRGERWRLRLHLAYCRACRRFRDQMTLLRRAARQLNDKIETCQHNLPGLSAEARERIRRAVDPSD